MAAVAADWLVEAGTTSSFPFSAYIEGGPCNLHPIQTAGSHHLQNNVIDAEMCDFGSSLVAGARTPAAKSSHFAGRPGGIVQVSSLQAS